MRAIIQRAKYGKVIVADQTVGEIKKGIVLFVGMNDDDNENAMKYILDKTILLRIFEDENDKMNLSLQDIQGELLIVPNFTLYGDARKGRRPSFSQGASIDTAKRLFEEFLNKAKDYPIKVASGIFQSDMEVIVANDGPVNILLDSDKLF